MKRNTCKLLALLLSGFMIMSGCGASDNQATEETAEKDAEQNIEENTEENTDKAADAADTDSSDDNNGENSSETVTGSDSADEAITPLSPEDLFSSVSSTPSRPTEEELLAGEKKNLVGIVMDATKYSVSVQTPDGSSYYLTIPDTGVSGNLNYITIGQIAAFTYAGSLDDTALLVDISSSDLMTGIYVEEYAFAIKIINAVKAMDMKALSDLTNFPVFLDTGSYNGPINSSGEFEVIDSEKIFSEALVNRIVNYNLFDLTYTDAGFVLGGNGTPNITFDVDDDGILGIIGINSAAPQENTKD